MAQWLKQSTSITVKIGPFLDDSDGNTAEDALTITQPDIRLSKNGGGFGQKAAAQTLAHDENGYYALTLDGTDTNTLGRLTVHVHESGALAVWHEFMVVTANVWDSMFGADKLQVDAVEISSSSAAANSVETNIGNLDASIQTLDTVADGIKSVTDNLPNSGALNDLATILTDTGTTLDDHLTDIKGTGFAKDTHSLTDIEGYVDLIDDGTSGLAKIATDVAAVLVDTANMQPKLGTPAADLAADIAALPTAIENTDEWYTRDWTLIATPAARSGFNALRLLRNKVSESGGTLTVTKENDTDTAWTATVTTDANADPIVTIDPA